MGVTFVCHFCGKTRLTGTNWLCQQKPGGLCTPDTFGHAQRTEPTPPADAAMDLKCMNGSQLSPCIDCTIRLGRGELPNADTCTCVAKVGIVKLAMELDAAAKTKADAVTNVFSGVMTMWFDRSDYNNQTRFIRTALARGWCDEVHLYVAQEHWSFAIGLTYSPEMNTLDDSGVYRNRVALILEKGAQPCSTP